MKILRTKTYKKYKKMIMLDKRSEKFNFIKDDREHYVYRVTDYSRNEKQHYYGSHTPAKGKNYKTLLEEFWTYKTSSNYNILNENKKENYKVKILKIFDNPTDKIIYEAFLHQYFNVKDNHAFWNENNANCFGFCCLSKESYDKAAALQKLTKSSEVWKKSIKTTKGTKLVIKLDKIVRVNCENNMFNSIFKGTVITNKGKRVNINEFNDFGYEGVKKGMVSCLDDTGNKVYISTDERKEKQYEYISNKITVQENGTFKRIDKADFDINKYQGVRKGKTTAKDIFGNTFSVDINDVRFSTGEITNANSKIVTAFNTKTFKIEVVPKNVFDTDDTLVGASSKRKVLFNGELIKISTSEFIKNINKYIFIS